MMKMNNKTKELIKYYGKGSVIILGVMLCMTLINVSVNEEIISRFWQGFIVASTGYIYIQHYHRQKKRKHILDTIESIEKLVKKYEDLNEQEKIIDNRLGEIQKEREEILNKDIEDDKDTK